jgi:hypothetical protein
VKKPAQSPVRTRMRSREKISDMALASFLDQLAGIYDSDDCGNPALADALRSLAKSVRRKSLRGSTGDSTEAVETTERPARPLKSTTKKPNETKATRALTPSELDELRRLTDSEIRRFIEDESKTKNDLLLLAAERFSIPVSQFRRLKSSEIRQSILSALLHESSIEILSEEAKREGNARSS